MEPELVNGFQWNKMQSNAYINEENLKRNK